MEHWLLYTSHREHGGIHIRGIFSSEIDAWNYWDKIILQSEDGENEKYWTIPHIQRWENENQIK